MQRFTDNETDQFTKITIGLSSPELILERSHGEVTKPETINYRSYKPEKDGLFSERIFGPTKDWECFCSKYRGIRYKGIICDRCGVEITRKDVRRKRMGHIDLAVPIVHIWFFKAAPSKIGNLLGMSGRDLEDVIYYEKYCVIQPGPFKETFDQGEVITETQYREAMKAVAEAEIPADATPDSRFLAMMGGEAIFQLLHRLDIAQLSKQLRANVFRTESAVKKAESIKRLRIIESFLQNGGPDNNRPEWMVMKVIPVVPPDLRPLLPLDGGRFATSDLNDLYRRVIIRNNRLKKLIEVNAPDVILRNEKRMLQEAVDSLFDNGRKTVAMRSDGNRPLKSLSDNLRGKQGRFRYNLLGKRVDYSGRSVIVVGPDLKLHQCGIPKDMAVELFKPFIIRKLIERDYAKTVKAGKRMVERKDERVWELLEEIIQYHPVMLNRAPTLHRLGIQAFQPILIEGKAIRLHPLVCSAFNADFDGDQMAVHIPLSYEAQIEARLLMLSPRNILHPANGRPIAIPSQDMVLGCYYITKKMAGAKGENKIFGSIQEALMAYDHGIISPQAGIRIRIRGEWVETTAGRAQFNDILPAQIQEKTYYNELLTKKRLEQIVSEVYRQIGFDETAVFLDNLKALGFKNATRGGLSISLSDVEVPDEKNEMIAKATKQVEEIRDHYDEGILTDGERYNKIIDIWTETTNIVSETMFKHLTLSQNGFNPLFMMADSGARGSKEQIRQLAGMRGLMAKPQKTMTGSKGEIIESPITANFKEGLSVLEYFISTHGARKGLADTALKTADAGYLTRRLVDVAQDVIVSTSDCGTIRGITVTAVKEGEEVTEQLLERIIGRTTALPVIDPTTLEEILPGNMHITEVEANIIRDSGVKEVTIRSPLTCEAETGICSRCYGVNLTNGRLVDIGEAVGVIAAQAIGEPGTQLTLRTFHVGGTASIIAQEDQVTAKGDGTVVWENMHMVEREDGTFVVLRRNGIIKVVDAQQRVLSRHLVPYAAVIYTRDGQNVAKGDILFRWDRYSDTILSNQYGAVKYQDIIEEVTYVETKSEGRQQKIITESKDRGINPYIVLVGDDGTHLDQYFLPVGSILLVDEGTIVKAGTPLVKILRSSAKSKDITGGLPRVAELFEARRPKDPATPANIDGIVKFGAVVKGSRKLTVTSTTDANIKHEYSIPVSRHLLVHDGEPVVAGERLVEGAVAPHDILQILGHGKVQEYLVNEIQEVYRLQGVKINDKHIEVIVRQMMQKVKIDNPGDTLYLEGDQVDSSTLMRENKKIQKKAVVLEQGDSKYDFGSLVDKMAIRREAKKIKKAGGAEPVFRDSVQAQSSPILLGITQASLATESFISAASFQETTRVLTEAAISRTTDELHGLKENVIMGHLVPAGTGMPKYRTLIVEPPTDEDTINYHEADYTSRHLGDYSFSEELETFTDLALEEPPEMPEEEAEEELLPSDELSPPPFDAFGDNEPNLAI